jgi:hypothetical protein
MVGEPVVGLNITFIENMFFIIYLIF